MMCNDVLNFNEQLDLHTVQCSSCDNVFQARPGSDLERHCIEREAAGLLDAVDLHGDPSLCPACAHKEEMDWRFYVEEVRPFEPESERLTEPPWVARHKGQ